MKKFIIIFSILFPLITAGQNVVVKKAVSKSDFPKIVWFTTGNIDTAAVKIFRAPVKTKKFKTINTLNFYFSNENSDTTFFTVIDTTLTEKGLYLYYIEVMRNGKPQKSEIAFGHNYGLLPSPHFSEFKAIPLEDRKAVMLKWKLDNPQTVSSLTLFRSRSYEKDYIKITDLPADTNSFIDIIPLANEPWFYFMVIKDYFGNKSVSVRVPAFATFAEKPVRPQNIHGKFKNDTIFLDWKNVGGNIIGYRIYRSIDGSPFLLVNSMQNNITGKTIFADYGDHIKKAVKLKYFVKNVSDGFVESNSSDTVEFYIASHEPVLPPVRLDCFEENYGNVKLIWLPPQKGLVTGYNIYITNPDGEKIALNKTLITDNFFIDSTYRKAGKYLYEIESVGYKNKLSEHKTVATFYRYPPKIHVILNIVKKKEGFEISWKKILNPHVDKITLYKLDGKGAKAVALTTQPASKDVKVIDKDIQPNNTYLYKLIATMENGDTVVVNSGVEMMW